MAVRALVPAVDVEDAVFDASQLNEEGLPALKKLLVGDLRKAAQELGNDEVRHLVDTYYAIQDYRKAANNQVLALKRSDEPHQVISWSRDVMEGIEVTIRKTLDYYTAREATGMGEWARDIMGIGPVLAAGLLAHIDITKAPSVGHIWRFAGLDPTSVWERKTKRPWNAALKVLCWKIGESFVKTSGREDGFYGKIYLERKQQEWTRNLAGAFADQAQNMLETKNFSRSTDAWAWYSGQFMVAPGTLYTGEVPKLHRADQAADKGASAAVPGPGTPMLPPAHIHARARRYAVKLFLSHWWEEAYRRHYGTEPPLPYPIAFLGHVHKIEAPELA